MPQIELAKNYRIEADTLQERGARDAEDKYDFSEHANELDADAAEKNLTTKKKQRLVEHEKIRQEGRREANNVQILESYKKMFKEKHAHESQRKQVRMPFKGKAGGIT